MDYPSIQARSAALLAKYGTTWTVTRGGNGIGATKGIRVASETTATQKGMTLASDLGVELLFTSAIVVMPGDKVSSGTTSLVVMKVAAVIPGGTVLLYRVTAS